MENGPTLFPININFGRNIPFSVLNQNFQYLKKTRQYSPFSVLNPLKNPQNRYKKQVRLFGCPFSKRPLRLREILTGVVKVRSYGGIPVDDNIESSPEGFTVDVQYQHLCLHGNTVDDVNKSDKKTQNRPCRIRIWSPFFHPKTISKVVMDFFGKNCANFFWLNRPCRIRIWSPFFHPKTISKVVMDFFGKNCANIFLD